MGEFHQHPDGNIFVRGDAGTYYSDRPENFTADFGVEPPALPDGADDHVYTQGRRHAFMGGGGIIAGGPMPWPEGDAIIANLDAGLAAQAGRQPMPVDISAAARSSPMMILLLDLENRLRALEGKAPLTPEGFEQRFSPLK